MRTTSAKRGLTIVEVVAVLAAAGLLVAVGLPLLDSTTHAERQAVCLANLRAIGAASLAYAVEDERNQIVPLHLSMVSTLASVGFPRPEWSWRTATPFSFGGYTATRVFPTAEGPVTVMTDPNGLWGTRTRPLNRYVFGDGDGAAHPSVFRCPADVGYPDSEWLREAPREAAGIPCVDFLGNSYRTTTIGLAFVSGSWVTAYFTSGPQGHRADSLKGNVSDVLLYVEPLVSNFARLIFGEDPPYFEGWHGVPYSDNAAYCDGSARLTLVERATEFTLEQLDEMGYTPDFHWSTFLRRTSTWRMDCYPTPGALVRVFTPAGSPMFTSAIPYRGWPFNNHQFNLVPGYRRSSNRPPP